MGTVHAEGATAAICLCYSHHTKLSGLRLEELTLRRTALSYTGATGDHTPSRRRIQVGPQLPSAPEKLKELEARLELAKANEHLMDPYQRQRLSEFEQEFQNARYDFFGGGWLTALLDFESLHHNYVDTVGHPDEGYGETFESWSQTNSESRARIRFRAEIRRRRN